MPKHVPLPSNLQTRAFLYRDGRDRAVGAGRLRGADLNTPFRGVRVPRDSSTVERDSFLGRCAAYAPLLTNGRYFSHVTAARLWNAPLPREFANDEPLHVSRVAPFAAPRMIGVAGHQSHEPRAGIAVRHGFLTADAVSMWLSLGSMLPVNELVVVGDHLILSPVVLDPLDIRPFATLAQLRSRLVEFHGRGARALHHALPLVRAGSESRPEGLLRLLILRGGLPEPALNVPVTDGNGLVLGRGDMVYEQWRTVVEYDGDQNRTSTRQYDRDIYRLESFRNAAWNVVQVRSRGLFINQRDTLSRIELALRAGGWQG